jgi:CHAT domain-containing protein
LPALVFGYTPSESEKEQNAFLGEANEIAQMFGVTAISGQAATPQALSHLAPKASWIHLSCHGNYQTLDPLSSQVTLHGGSFTARDWMKLALNAELITLSACQTGIQEINQGDEIMGFPRALFYAGTRTTLLTLWKVDAEATKIWMTNFYHALKECQPGSNRKAAAFQQATLALKEKYPAPYYWAPFILIGDAN